MFEDAIRNRTRLIFSYKDELRIVEPHAYGLTADGAPRLRAYQIHPEEGWRLFDVTKIALANFSGPRPGYKQGDSAMAKIIAEIEVEPLS